MHLNQKLKEMKKLLFPVLISILFLNFSACNKKHMDDKDVTAIIHSRIDNDNIVHIQKITITKNDLDIYVVSNNNNCDNRYFIAEGNEVVEYYVK